MQKQPNKWLVNVTYTVDIEAAIDAEAAACWTALRKLGVSERDIQTLESVDRGLRQSQLPRAFGRDLDKYRGWYRRTIAEARRRCATRATLG